MTKHFLKLNDRFFDAVANGTKTFEVRKNNRDFHIGDVLELVRTDSEGKHIVNNLGLNDYCICIVRYILTHDDFPDGVPEGYVVMSIEKTIEWRE